MIPTAPGASDLPARAAVAIAASPRRPRRRARHRVSAFVTFAAIGGASVTMIGSGPAAAQTILARDIAPFEVVYSVGNNVITAGKARLSLARDGENWIYTLATKPTGVFKLTGKGRIRETSVIDIVRTGDTVQLQPQLYSYRQDDERRRSVDAAFDWAGRTMTWQRRGEETSETFAEPILDRLSVTLAVMNALRNGFETLELEVFDNGRIKTMRFTNEGREILDTPMGEVETIRVRGETASGSSRSSRTWFAPALDYVPVRIEQRKRDELVARLQLTRLKNRVTDIEIVDSAANDVPPTEASGVKLGKAVGEATAEMAGAATERAAEETTGEAAEGTTEEAAGETTGEEGEETTEEAAGDVSGAADAPADGDGVGGDASKR